MKRLKVEIGAEADYDLTQVYLGVYDASRNLQVADCFLARLLARRERIGDAPRGGRPRDDLEPGLRTVPFERMAVIAYQIVSDRVLITNVFYGGRDFEALYRGYDAADDA